MLGNYIGTNAAGTAAVANAQGIRIENTADQQRHWRQPRPARATSFPATRGNGISIDTTAGAGNTILGNLIGVQRDAVTALANGGWGVEAGTSAVTIGGLSSGSGNVIANNGSGVVGGIWIRNGTSAGVVRGNSIYGNVGFGIDLDTSSARRPTMPATAIRRANDGQNTPVLPACHDDDDRDRHRHFSTAAATARTWSIYTRASRGTRTRAAVRISARPWSRRTAPATARSP